MHAIFEVLAAAVLAANRLWLPVFAQAVPDAGRFLVARPVLTVGDVLEWQAQLYQEWSRFQAPRLGIFEGPGSSEVLYDFQGFLNERVGVGKFFGGALFSASRDRVVGAQRARPHKVEVAFGVGVFVPL